LNHPTFDLLVLNGKDLRAIPSRFASQRAQASLRKAQPGVRLKAHLDHASALTVFQPWRQKERTAQNTLLRSRP